MTHKEFGESLKKFKRKHQRINHNPIRPLKYPENEYTILGHTALTSNVLSEKEGISGRFCYDAAKYDDERYI